MLKKLLLLLSFSVSSLILLGCTTSPAYPVKSFDYQKDIPRVTLYDSYVPKDYAFLDYAEKARQFDQALFDATLEGDHLPMIWNRTDSFGFGAYVGDSRGYVEGVSAISAVLSASLIGIDKSDDHGLNYVAMLKQFYNSNQKVILNNMFAVSTDNSLWYTLYPGILMTQVSLLYPEETDLRDIVLENIQSWYHAQTIFNDQPEGPNYAFTAFDFTTMEPVDNGIWTEPDSAVGIGMLMYYGYQLTAEDRYLEALIETMDYITQYFGSPLYELLHYYAPFLAAYLNAEHGTQYSLENLLNDTFDGLSIPRGGWGSMVGTWGDFPVDGLMGSTRDRKGYAFSMNSFASAFILGSFVSYDARYASSMGAWLLHLSSNGRYFFPDQIAARYQSCDYHEVCGDFNEKTFSSVPYEGIINGYNSRTPWVGGDPLINGWAPTDLSIYSGASTGLLGAMIQATDVSGILVFEVNKMARIGTHRPGNYLLYNPHPTSEDVTYLTQSKDPVYIFDLVSKTWVTDDAVTEIRLNLAPLESVILVEVAAKEDVIVNGHSYTTKDGTVLTQMQVQTAIENYASNDTAQGEVTLEFAFVSDVLEDAIASITYSVAGQDFTVQKAVIELDVEALNLSGQRTLRYTITMESGLTDSGQIILDFK